jgi:acyl carrier protein phosphodiesterase
MNVLAHIYLSGSNKLLMIGNFIGDAIKGRKYETLQPLVCKGILMHRAIDDFTDRHPINAEARKILYPYFGKYAGVYLDMFYDHFLASGWDDIVGTVSINAFCYRFYFDALIRYKHLPKRARYLLYLFIYGNRLKNYRRLKGMESSLEIMHRHSGLPRTGKESVEFLVQNYDTLKDSFYRFFPLLVDFTKTWRDDEL